MTKLMIIPSALDFSKDHGDAYLLGYQSLSMNFLTTVDMEQIKLLYNELKQRGKQLFIALNKNFHSCELIHVKEVMLQLAELKIDGILYYDVAVVQLKKKYKIDIPLIWGAEHLTTNYATMNYWHSQGADMAMVSGEITNQEILEIRENTNMPLIVPAFGHLPMFVSERHEVKNYLKYFKLNDHSSVYYMEKEGRRYPVVDNREGTFVYSSYILNAYQEYLDWKQKGIDYVTLNANFINPQVFQKIVEIFECEDGYDSMIDELLEGNTDKGFLYKETVYQVKKYED